MLFLGLAFSGVARGGAGGGGGGGGGCGGGGGGGGGGQLPLGADLRGAPKCLDVYYKYHCNAYQISRGKVYVNALMFID